MVSASHTELWLENLTCHRGGRLVFSDLCLSAAAGEAVQLAGANGRGKTTLLRTISGLQWPSSGQVLRRGDALHEASEDGHDALYLAHENALNPDLSPRENLAALVSLHSGCGSVTSALHRLGMAAHADQLCRRLSAGQRRRAALARLALSDAGLWLLDEPAAALDADGRGVLSELIAAHVGRGGTALFTTHEPLTLPGVTLRTVTL